jgi:hypothetical protein
MRSSGADGALCYAPFFHQGSVIVPVTRTSLFVEEHLLAALRLLAAQPLHLYQVVLSGIEKGDCRLSGLLFTKSTGDIS